MAAQSDLEQTYDLLVRNYRDACADPRPTYAVEGQSLSWSEYTESLLRQIEKLKPLVLKGQIVEISTPVRSYF